jgi:hypothetical protein
VVAVLGACAIVGNSLLMAFGEYMSSKAQFEYVAGEKRRAQWYFKHSRTRRIKEMCTLYQKKGLDREDANTVVQTLAKYEHVFVGLMLSEEVLACSSITSVYIDALLYGTLDARLLCACPVTVLTLVSLPPVLSIPDPYHTSTQTLSWASSSLKTTMLSWFLRA